MDLETAEILQAAAKANREILADEPLGVAIAEWAVDNGIKTPDYVSAQEKGDWQLRRLAAWDAFGPGFPPQSLHERSA